MGIEVKICGLTNYEDAALAVELGATHLGFIFAESPRQVASRQVSNILDKLDRRHLRRRVSAVGVFVNEYDEIIDTILAETGIDIAQIQGDETAQQTLHYRFPWYKALRFSSHDDVVIQLDRISWQCPMLLVDAGVPGVYGGTGITVATDIACYARDKIHVCGKKMFLAGGINPQNVAQIISDVTPDGIDICSGVESEKGRKSAEMMRQLFEQIKRCDN